MPYLVRAFPILAGKENQLRMMAGEIAGPRSENVQAFYKSLGVTHESWHVQKTPQGDFVIVITQIDNPEVRGTQYAAAHDDGFGDWFKARVRSLSGIDPDAQPLGPLTEQIFEWTSR